MSTPPGSESERGERPAEAPPASAAPERSDPPAAPGAGDGTPRAPEREADAPPGPVTGRPERHWFRARHEVLWLVVLALFVRAVAALTTRALPPDAVGLLDAVRAVRGGGVGAVLGVPMHPLPPLAVAWLARFLDAEVAATALSVLCGALAVWPLHALARRAAGRHAAGAACLLYVGLPSAVAVAAVPLTESLLLPPFLSALTFAAWACQSRAACGRRAALAGLLAGVAYLVRPEGLVAAAAASLVLLVTRGPRARRVAAFAAVFLVVATPYVVLLSSERGRFSLSPKKDVARFVGTDSSRPERAVVPAPGDARDVPTPGSVLAATLSGLDGALTVPVGILALVGLLTPRRWRHARPRRGRVLLAGTAAALIALVVRLQFGWGYGGGRHLLAAGVLLLPFAGAGLFVLAGLFPRVRSRRRFALFVALLLMIMLSLRAVLRPSGESGVAARHLGHEVAAAAREDHDIVVASIAEPRVAYYARRVSPPDVAVRDMPLWGPYVHAIELGAPVDLVVDRLDRALRDEGADWIVLDLWRRQPSRHGPEYPQRTVYEELLSRGRIERGALSAGSGLAAFRVLR